VLAELEPRLRKELPPGHYAFASIASEKSLLAKAEGDLPNALNFANDAVSIVEAAMKSGQQGGSSLPTLLVRRSTVESESGLQERAAADAQRALDLLQASLQSGMLSANVGHAYLALGYALKAQGKSDEGRTAFRLAAKHLTDTLGPDHPDSRNASQLAGLTLSAK
jgi:hypothetical protein